MLSQKWFESDCKILAEIILFANITSSIFYEEKIPIQLFCSDKENCSVFQSFNRENDNGLATRGHLIFDYFLSSTGGH